MGTKDVVIKDGKVVEALMGGMFRIELDVEDESKEVFGTLSGKMRKFKIRIMPGDRVKVEFSPHDTTRGRISYRYR
jgi:translation initiation factor IF-1